MTSPMKPRRDTKTIILAVFGLIGIAAWIVFDGALYPDGSIAESMITGLPVFLAYQVGVLARHLPGLDWLCNRFG